MNQFLVFIIYDSRVLPPDNWVSDGRITRKMHVELISCLQTTEQILEKPPTLSLFFKLNCVKHKGFDLTEKNWNPRLKADMITLNLSVIYSVVSCRAMLLGWSCNPFVELLRCVWNTWKRTSALRTKFKFRSKVCLPTARTLHPFITSRVHLYGWKIAETFSRPIRRPPLQTVFSK